jgi:4-hydroxy-2-oxoheptanedioate aldolase
VETNQLKARWRDGLPSFGGWCSIPSSFSAEVVASQPFDYVCVDMQHGLADYGQLLPMLQAVSIHGRTPVVRLPVGELSTAQRALDAGAQALIFPMISSAAEAAAAAGACRYAPAGNRSYGPIRSRMHLGSDPDHVNAQVACIVMIETRAAVDDLEAIVTTPGVDGVYVGPADLALALGYPIGSDDPELARTVARIASVAREHGVAPGIHTANGTTAARYCAEGFAFATISTDAAILSAAVQRELDAARGVAAGTERASIYG